MHTRVAHRVHKAMIVAIMLSLILPLGTATPVAAEGEECPEGLVYLVEDDFCVLPEDVPPDAEFIDQHADDGSEDEASSSDLSEPPDAEDENTADLSDSSEFDEEETDDLTGDDAGLGETDTVDDVIDDEEDVAAGAIRNVTVLTYSCPINWSPATKLLIDSYDVCTVAPAGGVSYSVLFEGTELITAELGVDIDIAANPGSSFLTPGLWSIQETSPSGLADPFAFCAIYAADGTQRMDVREFVPGGKLDILLAVDEEVNCEWFSVAEVPETVGDPNALPIGSITMLAASCPYGTSAGLTLEALVALCTDKGLAPVTYTASSGGIVSTQIGPTDSYDVDFQKGLGTRLLSGTWRISADLPPEYDESFIYCTITSEVGAVTDIEPETFFTQIDLDLAPGDNAICRWFNVENEPRIGASLGITLLLNVCPDGFDPAAGDYNTCTLPLPEPITFDFIHNGQVQETGTATAPQTTLSVTINGGKPESGEWTMRPTLWENREEPGWSCSGVDAAGGTSFIDYFDPMDGLPGMSAKFGPNHKLECNVWIYTTVITESASVALFSCPEGFDPAVSTDADRMTSCTPEDAGYLVTFEVDGEEVGTDRGNAVGNATSSVIPGLLRISVDSGQDQITGFVVCDQIRTDLDQIQTIEIPVNSDQQSITVELDANDKLDCQWFLIPSVSPVAVDDEDADVGEVSEVPVDDTPDDTSPDDGTSGPFGGGSEESDSGVSAVNDDASGNEDASDAADGEAGESEGTGGSFGGGSEEPDSSESTADGGDQSEVPAEPDDDGTTSGADDGSDQTGDVPAESEISNLAIQKWICTDPLVAGASYDDLTLACGPTLEPSSWTLNEIPIDSETGQIIWDDPGTGSLVVSLSTSAMDSDSMVYCTVEPIGGEALEQQSFQVAGGEITITVAEPSEVYCNWFVHE